MDAYTRWSEAPEAIYNADGDWLKQREIDEADLPCFRLVISAYRRYGLRVGFILAWDGTQMVEPTG